MLWRCIRYHVRTHGKLFRSFTDVVRKGLSGSQTPLPTGITGVFKTLPGLEGGVGREGNRRNLT